EDYRTLYTTFIHPSAPLRVHLSSRVAEDIEKQVGEGSRVLPLVSVFDEARNEVLVNLFEMFPRFLDVERDGCVRKFLKGATREYRRDRSRRPTDVCGADGAGEVVVVGSKAVVEEDIEYGIDYV
ncbi:hypothetical protein HKX48_007217, partial [Thoreauomyces humboldtii]